MGEGRSRRVGHAAAVVVTLLAFVAVGLWRSNVWGAKASTGEVAVSSSGPAFATLEQLVDASDVVIIGRVRAVTAGRVFGTSDNAVVRSHIVELDVGAVLAGDSPGAVVSIEEEASTLDGQVLIVDGLRPTRLGDEGIFFLEHGLDASVPYYATVSSAGRYLRRSLVSGNDQLLGAGSYPLGRELADRGGRRLTDAVVARARATGRPVGPLPS